MTHHLHTIHDPRIFVFGSNVRGIHGAGAAAYARTHLGAENGVGEGPTGRCYALPTCSMPGVTLSLSDVRAAVDRFMQYAEDEYPTRFFVSAVGCGLAGFTETQIAPMFAYAPVNCDVPPGWRR